MIHANTPVLALITSARGTVFALPEGDERLTQYGITKAGNVGHDETVEINGEEKRQCAYRLAATVKPRKYADKDGKERTMLVLSIGSGMARVGLFPMPGVTARAEPGTLVAMGDVEIGGEKCGLACFARKGENGALHISFAIKRSEAADEPLIDENK